MVVGIVVVIVIIVVSVVDKVTCNFDSVPRCGLKCLHNIDIELEPETQNWKHRIGNPELETQN